MDKFDVCIYEINAEIIILAINEISYIALLYTIYSKNKCIYAVRGLKNYKEEKNVIEQFIISNKHYESILPSDDKLIQDSIRGSIPNAYYLCSDYKDFIDKLEYSISDNILTCITDYVISLDKIALSYNKFCTDKVLDTIAMEGSSIKISVVKMNVGCNVPIPYVRINITFQGLEIGIIRNFTERESDLYEHYCGRSLSNDLILDSIIQSQVSKTFRNSIYIDKNGGWDILSNWGVPEEIIFTVMDYTLYPSSLIRKSYNMTTVDTYDINNKIRTVVYKNNKNPLPLYNISETLYVPNKLITNVNVYFSNRILFLVIIFIGKESNKIKICQLNNNILDSIIKKGLSHEQINSKIDIHSSEFVDSYFDESKFNKMYNMTESQSSHIENDIKLSENQLDEIVEWIKK